jgi:uncharacterized protein YkwD
MRKIILFSILAISIGAVFFFWNDILNFYLEFSLKIPQIKEDVDGLIQRTGKQISTPPPLRVEEGTPEAFLTRSGVIQWTNTQREKNGLPPLSENSKLNASAEIKAEDMFDDQYFSHYSSSGVGAGDLAESTGYQFIAVGENLALGNFKSDETLVQAWMDSPGHRENILNANYQEIGVSVVEGFFEGQSVWMAVQHFGRPLSSCPQVDESLPLKIEENQDKIDNLEDEIVILKLEIQSMKPKRGSSYNQKIEQYNDLVAQYNALIEETSYLIELYNSQVKLFNQCVSGEK